jgi:purine-binding chemotaxis protein CheW
MPDSNSQSEMKLDWDEVKQRLALAQQAQTASERLTPEQVQQVMDRRAATLARVPDRRPDSSEILEVITFPLGQEQFAVETVFVREVYRSGDITPLPGSPAFVVGLTNLRGEVLAVMDLRKFFGIDAAEEGAHPQVVVLGNDRVEFGILVDDVYEVTTLRLEEILEPPGSVAGASRDYLRGVTKDALSVLDGAALLKDERLYVDEKE